MEFYQPKYFKAYELVPADIFNSLEEWRIWLLFDPRILWTIDRIRELYGKPMTVNNWKSGGPFSLRGWRPSSVDLVKGVLVDQHKYGRAIDFDIAGVPASSFVSDVLSRPAANEFQYITGLEIASWNHIDCRNYDRALSGGKPLTFKA